MLDFLGSCCLEEVLNHISKELTEKESKKLLRNLGIDDDDPQKEFSEKLEDVPWLNLKKQLEKMGKDEIIDHIKKNTLITQGTHINQDIHSEVCSLPL